MLLKVLPTCSNVVLEIQSTIKRPANKAHLENPTLKPMMRESLTMCTTSHPKKTKRNPTLKPMMCESLTMCTTSPKLENRRVAGVSTRRSNAALLHLYALRPRGMLARRLLVLFLAVHS